MRIPQDLQSPIPIVHEANLPKNPSTLFLCGMGGSGIVGDLLQGLFSHIPIVVHKNYGLPVLAKEKAPQVEEPIEQESVFVDIDLLDQLAKSTKQQESMKNLMPMMPAMSGPSSQKGLVQIT